MYRCRRHRPTRRCRYPDQDVVAGSAIKLNRDRDARIDDDLVITVATGEENLIDVFVKANGAVWITVPIGESEEHLDDGLPLIFHLLDFKGLVGIGSVERTTISSIFTGVEQERSIRELGTARSQFG